MDFVPCPSADVCNPQVRIVCRDLGMEDVAAELRDDPMVIV